MINKLANMSFTKTVSDPQGRQLSFDSPDGSTPSEQELDQMFQVKYGPKGVDFGQVANEAFKGATNPSPGSNPIISAGQSGLNSIQNQASDSLLDKMPNATKRGSLGRTIQNVGVKGLADMVAMGGVDRGIDAASEAMQPKNVSDILKRISGLENKGYKLSSEVIPVDQTENIIKGTPHPAVEQFFKNSTPAKTAEDLQGQMQGKAEDLMTQRKAILENSNKPQSREYLNGLYKEIEGIKSQPQTPKVKSILKGMQDVYDAEVENLNNGGELDSLKAESRKEWHGKQSGIEKGFPQETSPGTIQAHDILRNGLKNQLETSHPEIASLNEPYGGLTGASESLADLVSTGLKTKTPGPIRQMLGKVLPWLIENPIYRAGSIAKELATEGESNILGKSTSRISDIRDQVEQLKKLLPDTKQAVVGGAIGGSALAASNAQASQTIGQKNNNPGNLKGNDKWIGATGHDKFGHVTFDTPEHGARALQRDVQTHQARHPEHTLTDFMNSYAAENGDSEARFIAGKLGVKPNSKISSLDSGKVAKAIAQFESKSLISLTKSRGK